MNVLVADVETDGFLDEATRIWCLGIGDPATEEVIVYSDYVDTAPSLESGLQRLREADKVAFHNGLGFDLFAINKMYPGTLRFDQIYDTLVVARLFDPEGKHGLSVWGETFGFPKGDMERFDVFDPEMLPYCERDVAITIKLYNRQQPDLERWGDSILNEHQVRYVIALQEQHGFRLDVKKAEKLTGILRQEQEDLAGELRDTFGIQMVPSKGQWCMKTETWTDVEVFTPKQSNKTLFRTKGHPFCKIEEQMFNPGSRQQIAQRLSKKYSWKPTKFTDSGAPQLDESVLEDLRFPEAVALSRYFRLSKQLGQVSNGDNAWLKLVDDNDYVHGAVNTNGARTNRMSHFKPNMAQVDKKDKRMREVWLPDEGHILVGCDAEGLELRMLAHYLSRHDKGAYVKTVVFGTKEEGTDAHTRNKNAAGLLSRDSAKTLIYAYLYGAGNPKLGLTVYDDGVAAGKKMPKNMASLGMKARRNLEAGITGLDRLIKGVHNKHSKVGWFRSLDGRYIKSVSKHSALNTLLQGAGAVVMKWALTVFHYELCVEKGWVDPDTFETTAFHYCANVHDEVQLSVPEELSEEIGQTFAEAIRIAGERLQVRCPLSGSYDVGDNWCQTH